MKKIIALILVLMVGLFAGCSDTKDAQKSEEQKEEQKKEIAQEKNKNISDKASQEEKEESEKIPEEPQRTAEIDSVWNTFIGKSISHIVTVKGDMSESYWEDGPIYRFGSENVWYAFENYDFADDNSYIPLGNCTEVSVPLKLLIKTDSGYNADSLEAALGKSLVEGYDMMYECRTYSATYQGLTYLIYEDSRAAINADSMINIERE